MKRDSRATAKDAARPQGRVASSGRDAVSERVRRFFLRPESAALAGTIVVFVAFTFAAHPLFVTEETFVSVTNVVGELGVVAVGVTLLMICGHFDLSVGAVLGFSSYVAIFLINNLHFPLPLAFVGTLVVAGAIGLANGLIVVKTGMHSFIVTLGSMLIVRGLLTAGIGGYPVTVDLPGPTARVVAGDFLPGNFRMSFVWFLIFVAGATVVLLRTRLGNWIQAIGQNVVAARSLGIPVARTTVSMFVLTSVLAGFAGLIQLSRFASVDAERGSGYELTAIAITVIGGTLLTGGYGSAVGTVLGAFIFGMMQVGLVLAGAPGYYFITATGAVLLGAVAVNTAATRRIAAYRPRTQQREQEGTEASAANPETG